MSRRGKICARQLTAGPGSCSYWWGTCPRDVKHCFMRFVRENGAADSRGTKSITADQAAEWDRQRGLADAR